MPELRSAKALRRYKDDPDLNIEVELIPDEFGTVVVKLTADVVGSDGMIEDRRATWIMGGIRRTRTGSIHVVNTARNAEVLYRDILIPLPVPIERWTWRNERKAFEKVSNSLSYLLVPHRIGVFTTAGTRDYCNAIYAKMAVLEVMGA